MISIYSVLKRIYITMYLDLFIEAFQNVPFRKNVSPHSSGLLTYTGEALTIIQRFDVEANLDDSLWIEIKQKGESILLCDIYRPPGTPVSIWHRLNEKALEASKRIIIVGDLNEDQLNVQNYHVKDILTINNLVNTIEVPTRVTTTSATLLDLIIVTHSEKKITSQVLLKFS